MNKQDEILLQFSINDSLNLIETEVKQAKDKYPSDFNSFHEGYAVLLEEVDELWDEVKKRKHDKIRIKEEAVQVAAMAVRIISELCNE